MPAPDVMIRLGLPEIEDLDARLALFRAAMGSSEPEPTAPATNELVDAFRAALADFATADGSLKVANQTGGYVRGG